jgi:hypothetical protein
VGWGYAHQDANAKNVIGVEAATVGGDSVVFFHRSILPMTQAPPSLQDIK